MTTPPASAGSPAMGLPHRCQADPRCPSTPCFRVEIHDPPGTVIDGKTTDTCATHVGDTVQDFSRWATDRELTDGRIQVCVIDGSLAGMLPGQGTDSLPASFLFASIPLAS